MQFSTKFTDLVKHRSQCIIVGIYTNKHLTPSATTLNAASHGLINKVISRGDISGKIGETLTLYEVTGIQAQRILLVGLGDKQHTDGPKFIRIVHAAITTLKKIPCKNVLCCLLETATVDKDNHWKARRLIEQFHAGLYQFTDFKSKATTDQVVPERIVLKLQDKSEQAIINRAIREASALALGVRTTKDLGNTPSNICIPNYLAQQSRLLAKQYRSISTEVLSEKRLEELGMGSFLSVGHGSAQPSKLIVMRHKGAKVSDRPYVLVGKGITFDTGGISLKPAGTMYDMIYDMCGAASVLGTMQSVAALELPINVVGVIAAAENMPSGKASRPGDIVTSMSGQTIEILNTDAEGRLVLCDALTYVEKFKPATVIDIATLTGACIIALGHHASAMYTNDATLAQDINAAAVEVHDRVWQMPLWEDYQDQLKSAFADVANIGGSAAGSITAACFLARFTKPYRWAHLDVAGTAFKGGVGPQKGATGRPVPLLVQYLMDRANETTR